MAQQNIRSARRHRHEGKSGGVRRGESMGGRQQDYATAGEERGERRRDPQTDPRTLDTSPAATESGEHATAFGEQYGQGFGVGAGHGVESDAAGLGGSPREREYRGNAGMTYGATVGPDALKEDTSQDKRPDEKPA